MSGNKARTPRKPHPHFGFIAKLPLESVAPSGARSPHEPALTPTEEQGVLWAGFRQS